LNTVIKRPKAKAFFDLVNRRIRRLRCLPVLPRTFCLAVTYKCNGKCTMCNLWKVYRENPKLVKEELSLSEIQNFLSDREFFKDLDFVYLSGGEPFLREDLPEIVKSIHECNPTCIVYVATNGFLTDNIIKTTKEIFDELKKSVTISRTKFYRVLDEMIRKGLVKILGKENRLSLLYKAL